MLLDMRDRLAACLTSKIRPQPAIMSLTRLASQTLIKVNFHRLDKVFTCKSEVLNKCMRHSAVLRQNKLNFFSQEIISRKYSTKTTQVSGALGVSNNLEEDKEEKYDDHYDSYIIEHEDQEVERTTPETKEMIFEEIAGGDAEILKKLKLLEFEMAVLREQGNLVVKNPTKLQWKELLRKFDSSLAQKTKLLSFMALNEKLGYYKLKKKDLALKIKLKTKEEAGFHYYGLSGQSIIPCLGSSLDKLTALKSCMANRKLLIDCSYDEYMNEACKRDLAKQIKMSILEMKYHHYPCQLGICNVEQNSEFGEIIEKYLGNVFNENFFYEVSAQSPVALYPKERLVYLTPHTQNDLIEINKDDIYIIGGFVDKGSSVMASLAKAKKEHLRVARLPLDLYLSWKQGIKTLPLNIVVKIMLDMMFYNDWNTAFKSITKRSINKTLRNKDNHKCSEVEISKNDLQSIFNK